MNNKEKELKKIREGSIGLPLEVGNIVKKIEKEKKAAKAVDFSKEPSAGTQKKKKSKKAGKKSPGFIAALSIFLALLTGVGVSEYYFKNDQVVNQGSDSSVNSMAVIYKLVSEVINQTRVTVENSNENEDKTVVYENPLKEKKEKIVHEYEYIVSDISWGEAFQECLNKGGYLAHIESQEEWDQVIGEISAIGKDNVKFYIGGRREDGANDYYWLDANKKPVGEKINSTKYESFWLSGEPSYRDGSLTEQYMMMFYYDNGGYWVLCDVSNNVAKDVPMYKGRVGYICEYERKVYE
ncbi:MAG: C-type lectin domain-containing protein [Eubacteriaceae bacterium]